MKSVHLHLCPHSVCVFLCFCEFVLIRGWVSSRARRVKWKRGESEGGRWREGVTGWLFFVVLHRWAKKGRGWMRGWAGEGVSAGGRAREKQRAGYIVEQKCVDEGVNERVRGWMGEQRRWTTCLYELIGKRSALLGDLMCLYDQHAHCLPAAVATCSGRTMWRVLVLFGQCVGVSPLFLSPIVPSDAFWSHRSWPV